MTVFVTKLSLYDVLEPEYFPQTDAQSGSTTAQVVGIIYRLKCASLE